MHSDRDVYGQQTYATVLRENGRLAKTKACALDDLNSQIYINVFATKARLRCFAVMSDENENWQQGGDEARALKLMMRERLRKGGKGIYKKKGGL